MQQLTPAGENIINDISRRYNLSHDSAVNMLVAVNRGGGSMAQFSCPELGSGQWMRGGMTMVSDMFNNSLKNTVNNLCDELSNALANHQMFPPASQDSSAGGGNWWPGDLGTPSSSGSQNNSRYAFFPGSRRLAVEQNGQVTVYDTLDHQIGGVSQQQGGSNSLTFSSQYGTLTTLSLPLISGAGKDAEQSTNFAAFPTLENQAPTTGNDSPKEVPSEILDLLEKLGHLRDSGILTSEEFAAKKSELLKRL